jgi:DNA-binding NarL/FixJ family response regulator
MTLRVLIASRKVGTRERLRAALEKHGCDVCASCADAAEAIAASGRRRAHVCVIHLDLPGGGITACRALAARSRPPRILVLAPASRENDLAAAIRAGADGFIVDDLDLRRIPGAVAEVAAGRPVLSTSSTARLIAELRAPATQRTLKGQKEEP